MAKKKILSFMLSLCLTALPSMQCSQAVPCYAGVKTDGQNCSILCVDRDGSGRTKNSSSTDQESEWKQNQPERIDYPLPGINTSINQGFITDPDLPVTDFPDIIHGTVTDGSGQSGSDQKSETCPGQDGNKQETDSSQDNGTDSDPTDNGADNPPAPEIPSTEKEPEPDLPAEQPSDPEGITQTYAVLNASTEKITANSNGILSEPSIYIDTEDTGGFKIQAEACGWLKIGKQNLKQNSSNSISFSESGRFYIFVGPNKSLSPRTGTIPVTHETGTEQVQIIVKQEALHAELEISASQKTADRNGLFYNNDVNVETNHTGSYSVKINDGCEWLGYHLKILQTVISACQK